MSNRRTAKLLGWVWIVISGLWNFAAFISTAAWVREAAPDAAEFLSENALNRPALILFLGGVGFLALIYWLDWRDREKDRKTAEENRRRAQESAERQKGFANLEEGGQGNRFIGNLAEGADYFVRSGGQLDDSLFQQNDLRTSVTASRRDPVVLSKEQIAGLQTTCLDLSQELRGFLHERGRLAPRRPETFLDAEDYHIAFDEYRRQLEAHSAETMHQYESNFGARVRFAAILAADNGYRDERLLSFSDNPTNALGVKEIAKMLGVISEAIKYNLDR
jgi:hypothetical protein